LALQAINIQSVLQKAAITKHKRVPWNASVHLLVCHLQRWLWIFISYIFYWIITPTTFLAAWVLTTLSTQITSYRAFKVITWYQYMQIFHYLWQ